MPSSLLQVVNNLFQTCYNKLGTSSAKTTCWQLVNRLVTTCLQTCKTSLIHDYNTRFAQDGLALPKPNSNLLKKSFSYSWFAINLSGCSGQCHPRRLDPTKELITYSFVLYLQHGRHGVKCKPSIEGQLPGITCHPISRKLILYLHLKDQYL